MIIIYHDHYCDYRNIFESVYCYAFPLIWPICFVSSEKEEIEKVNNGAEEGEDVTETHVFAQAVTFVEKNDELVHNMRRLDEAREKLEDVSSSLEKTVAKVKEQALVAMDGYWRACVKEYGV